MATRTFLLIDGENLDATLGNTILGRAPRPAERPRWERVLAFAEELWGQDVTGLFFLNIRDGHIPGPFVQALQAIGFRAVLLTGPATEKVVDVGIQRTLDAIVPRDGDVLLGSHDRDFVDRMATLQDSGHRVALLAFTELVSGAYADHGIPVHDLEHDAGAFNLELPRIRVIPLDRFDPAEFLD